MWERLAYQITMNATKEACTKVEHVKWLIKVSIAQNCGIQRCLELLDKAAQQVYHTWNYTKEDKLCGLLLWQLGGGQVADIAHQALGLPSVRTLCQQTLIPRLIQLVHLLSKMC